MALTNIQVPEKIKCLECGVVRSSDAYSNKRLKDLDAKMKRTKNFDPTKDAYIVCGPCTPKPAVEKECTDCGVTKPRIAFNDSQFKKDEPLCEKCRIRREIGSDGEDGGDGGDGSEGYNGYEDEECGTETPSA